MTRLTVKPDSDIVDTFRAPRVDKVSDASYDAGSSHSLVEGDSQKLSIDEIAGGDTSILDCALTTVILEVRVLVCRQGDFQVVVTCHSDRSESQIESQSGDCTDLVLVHRETSQ